MHQDQNQARRSDRTGLKNPQDLFEFGYVWFVCFYFGWLDFFKENRQNLMVRWTWNHDCSLPFSNVVVVSW